MILKTERMKKVFHANVEGDYSCFSVRSTARMYLKSVIAIKYKLGQSSKILAKELEILSSQNNNNNKPPRLKFSNQL